MTKIETDEFSLILPVKEFGTGLILKPDTQTTNLETTPTIPPSQQNLPAIIIPPLNGFEVISPQKNKPTSGVPVVLRAKDVTPKHIIITPVFIPASEDKSGLKAMSIFSIKNWNGRLFLENRRFFIYHRLKDGKFYWDIRNKGVERTKTLWGPYETIMEAYKGLCKHFKYDDKTLQRIE